MPSMPQHRRIRSMNILSICIIVQVFVAVLFVWASLVQDDTSLSGSKLHSIRRLRSKIHFQKPFQKISFQKSSITGQKQALKVKNIPQILPRRVGSKVLESSPIVKVDSYYVYNPSIVELADGSNIFAARMSWLYGGNCQRYAQFEDPETMYNCLKTHITKFADQSLLGVYHPKSFTLEITSPSIELVDYNDADYQDVTSWNGGPGWFDTRLIHPYSYRHNPLNTSAPKILMSSQNTELLGYHDWHELGESTLALQLTYIRPLDVQSILHSHKTSITKPIQEKTKMTRWLFYDAKLEQEEWERRRKGQAWTPNTADVARLKCQTRPSSLPALPFTPGISDFHRHSQHHLSAYDSSRNVGVIGTPDFHRREPGMKDMNWHTIKDKNWAPFVYNDENVSDNKSRVLWSYSLEPHVVCENDIDLNEQEAEDVDCVLCIAKYNSSSPEVFEKFYKRLHEQGYDKAVAHLNGAPAYYMEDRDVYLGLMHTITTEYRTDTIGRKEQRRVYHHYFYQMEAQPPFRIVAIAEHRVPLLRSRCWSPWFEVDDIVEAEFAMNMQYHPDRPNQEIVISYGDGDRYARVDTFSLEDVWQSF